MKKTILILAILILVFVAGCEKKVDCARYSYDSCPSSCVVCPPCEVCSSISCQTEEFCKDLGFDKNWYETVRPK
jgi:hypothetical protein